MEKRIKFIALISIVIMLSLAFYESEGFSTIVLYAHPLSHATGIVVYTDAGSYVTISGNGRYYSGRATGGCYFTFVPSGFYYVTVVSGGGYSYTRGVYVRSYANLGLSSDDDTGTSDNDNITQKGSGLTISGFGENGSAIRLYDNGNEISGATATVTEVEFSIDISLSEGTHTITATQTSSGETSEHLSPLEITVDKTPPSVEILNPLNYSFNPLFISGSASDALSGLGNIKLQMSFSDSSGTYYLSDEGEFISGDAHWIKLPVQESWSFDASSVNWIEEDIYKAQVRVADKAGNTSLSSVLHIIGGVTGDSSAITCNLSEEKIILGESFKVEGQITSDSPLSQAGAWVNITLISPDGEKHYRPERADMAGNFTYETACEDIFRAGTWVLQTGWNGDYGLRPAFSNIRKIEVSKAESEVRLNASSQNIKMEEIISLSGRFFPNPNCGADISDIELSLLISGPSGEDNVPVSLNELGFFVHAYQPEALGEHTIQVKFEGNDAYLPSESEPIKITVAETAGYAIIVQGRTRSGEGVDDHNKTTQFLYNTLKERDFQENDIRYFNYDTSQEGVYAVPTKDGVSATVTSWAKEKMNERPANLYIVAVGHGVEDRFFIHDSEPITSADLDNWLDTLQNSLTGQARNQEIVVILGFCHAGSFIPELSGDNRIIISSAAPDEFSFRGNKDEDGIREGEYFVAEFFKAVSFGKSVRECFEYAAELTESYTSDLKLPPSFPYFDHSRQHPLLDDNGNRDGTNDLSVAGADGLLSGNIFIGVSAQTANYPGDVSVVHVADTVFLDESDTATKDLWAFVDNTDRLDAIWIEVKSPDCKTEAKGADADFDGQLALELPKYFGTYNPENGRFEWHGNDGKGIGGFEEPGTYQIFYFAKDIYTGNISSLMETRVCKAKPKNNPPYPFGIIFPKDGEEVPVTSILDWEGTADPDGDRLDYTVLMVKDDPSSIDAGWAIRKQGLTHSICAISPDDGIQADADYYWKVRAVDEYGAVRETELSMFHTPAVNAGEGWIRGYITDASTREYVDAFEVVVGDKLAEGSEGYYLQDKSPGKCSIKVKADGYLDSESAEVEIPEGDYVTRNFNLKRNAVGSPVFSPRSGIYTKGQYVEISSPVHSAVIRYTTDGTEPDETSQEYTQPVVVSADITIKAKTYTDEGTSLESQARYKISSRGNINGDDNIDLRDALLVLRVLIGTEQSSTVKVIC